jgi:hypothetical protein
MPTSRPEIRRVDTQTSRRLIDGLVTTCVLMGCLWYALYRLWGIGREGAAALGASGAPVAVTIGALGVQLLALVALCAFIFGVAALLPHLWMVLAGFAFIAFDLTGHLIFGSGAVLLLHHSVFNYLLLAALLLTSVQARRLRSTPPPRRQHPQS